MTTTVESESTKSPETIEREIDQQRNSISNIVDALETKLTPGQLFDQALSFTKGNGSVFFHNLGNTLKNNPVPTALTSIGLLWLMMNQNKPFHASPSYSSGPGLGERMSAMVETVADKLGSTKTQVGDSAHALKDSANTLKDNASHLGDTLSDALHASTDRVSQAAHDTGERIRQGTQQLKGQFDHLLTEQPLVVAAVGLALGAILGAALPMTQQENRWMGETSDNVTDKIKQQASEGYEKVREAASEIKDKTLAAQSPASMTPLPSTGSDLSRGLGSS